MDSLAQCHLWLTWETSPDAVSPLAITTQVKASRAWFAPAWFAPAWFAPTVAIAAGATVLGSGLGTPALANEHRCNLRTLASANEPLWGKTVYVNTREGYALNVRWGPGTNTGIQRCVLRGSALQLSGARSGNWVQLIDKTWVAGKLVNDQSPVIPPTTCNVGNLATVVIPQNFALNIRPGPGFNFPVVGQFEKGSCITVTGKFYVGWAQLTNGNWVDSSRIEYSGPITNVTQPPLDDVIELQRRLRQAGFLPANFVLSGIYDPATQSAVRESQRVNRLPVTGIANEATWQALRSVDNNVMELQRLLIQAGYLPPSFVISGNYDQTTQNAVRQFQRVNRQPVTGTVNAATWRALYQATAPTPTPSPTPSPTPDPTPDPPPSGSRQMRVVTDGDSTSIHDGPGTEFDVLRNVSNGSIVTVTGRKSGNWSELIEGGWIFSLWLDEM